jgi:hypothetical protein
MEQEKTGHSENDDCKDAYEKGYEDGRSDREQSDYTEGSTKSSEDVGILSSPDPWGDPWDKEDESDSEADS